MKLKLLLIIVAIVLIVLLSMHIAILNNANIIVFVPWKEWIAYGSQAILSIFMIIAALGIEDK